MTRRSSSWFASRVFGSSLGPRLGVALVLAFGPLGLACSAAEEPTEEVRIDPPASPAQALPRTAPASAPATALAPEVRAALLAGFPDERAPDEYRAILDTTKGPIEIAVHRAWAPLGADRFYTLVKHGYFADIAFFRVIPGFMAQFGMAGDPAVNDVWRGRTLMDEPVVQSNTRGRITFAKTGMPNSRSNQFFINFGNNANLDPMGFAAFGEVRDMSVVDSLYGGYGEGAPRGRGPDQQIFGARGNAYLREQFPELDYVRSARIEP